MNEILNKTDEKAKSEYESFVSSHKNGCFMQSLRWTDVKKDWDYEAVISRNENGKIRGTALFLIKKIPVLGCAFLYSPHGPVCDFKDRDTLEDIFEGADKIREMYNCYELRIDPNITENDKDEIGIFKSLGFDFRENAPELTTIQARNNYILKIKGKSCEEIFEGFHKKWRYNIRLAERKGVECRICGTEALDDFYELMKETGERDGFCIRSREYFSRMIKSLGNHCRLYMCYFNGEPLSGAISVQYAGKTCYVYGASTSKMRNLMPNYLMQWRMICWAAESGCDIYDFQGIPFYKDETHPNYGVYRFKQGFRGEVMTYAGEFTKTYSKVCSEIIEKTEKISRRIFHINPASLFELFRKNKNG
ncbi:MAG: lipid II:glycine glycyltransferase FemX [Porcipelethomonas sp.]